MIKANRPMPTPRPRRTSVPHLDMRLDIYITPSAFQFRGGFTWLYPRVAQRSAFGFAKNAKVRFYPSNPRDAPWMGHQCLQSHFRPTSETHPMAQRRNYTRGEEGGQMGGIHYLKCQANV